ncbi:hypothetical protein GQ600_25530 [Phytophthora cactorum]|nr:hypothetical protein GQ600_25530 [Phytophthora cactorum]
MVVFTIWWFVFLGVHLATCGYNLAYALFYWWLNDTEIRQYLVFYHVGMPPDYYDIIATVHLVMSSIHGSCIVLMAGSSLWLRKLAFTPWEDPNILSDHKNKGPMQVIEVQTRNTNRVNSGLLEGVLRNTSRVNSAIHKGVTILTTKITNRYGILGVNGQYFHVVSIIREFLETSLQTIQATV